jgi:hypothetical protein
MNDSTKFFKKKAFNVSTRSAFVAAMRPILLRSLTVSVLLGPFHPTTSFSADYRGLGEVDVQISSNRIESSSSADSSRSLRLGIFGGLLMDSQEKDRLSFGGFFKTDRGQKTIGSYNSYDVGLFVGWERESLGLRLAYTLFGELKAMNGFIETAWRQASGYEISLRWTTWTTELAGDRAFALGPSLSYEKISYKKSQAGSLPETDQESGREALVPGVSFVFVY